MQSIDRELALCISPQLLRFLRSSYEETSVPRRVHCSSKTSPAARPLLDERVPEDVSCASRGNERRWRKSASSHAATLEPFFSFCSLLLLTSPPLLCSGTEYRRTPARATWARTDAASPKNHAPIVPLIESQASAYGSGWRHNANVFVSRKFPPSINARRLNPFLFFLFF